jgi:hypothetical protein
VALEGDEIRSRHNLADGHTALEKSSDPNHLLKKLTNGSQGGHATGRVAQLPGGAPSFFPLCVQAGDNVADAV